MLVHEFLEKTTKRFPDKTALIFQDQRLTYKQINEKANQLAHALLDAGLKKGDRVSILLDNSSEAVISIFGVLKAGGVFSTLSPTLKAKKLDYILNNSDASFLISQWQKIDVVSKAITNSTCLKSVILCGLDQGQIISTPSNAQFVDWNSFIDNQPFSKPEISCIDIDLANIIYTSGSTGNPKGVMMTHLNMASAATSIITYLENCEPDIILNVLPLSFDYGLYQVIMSSMFGGTIVLEKSFSFPYVVIDKLIKENVTGFPIVPTILAILLQLKNLDKYDFQDLRYISNTGAALPVNHIKSLRQLFPNVTYLFYVWFN